MTGGLIVRPSPHLPPVREWVRPGRVPSKAAGRVGTRRAWKRKHPPGWVIDPTRTQSFRVGDVLYVDPASFDRLCREMTTRRHTLVVNDPPGSKWRQSVRDITEALRAVGVAATEAGAALGGLVGVSASYVVSDALDDPVHPDLAGDPNATPRAFDGLVKR